MDSSSTSTSLRDKFRGLMLGAAAGDCLGRPIEGHRSVADSYLSGLLTSPTPLIYTDDTAMAVVLARSLLDRGGFSGADMAAGFAEEYRSEPFRGYGRTWWTFSIGSSEGSPGRRPPPDSSAARGPTETVPP